MFENFNKLQQNKDYLEQLTSLNKFICAKATSVEKQKKYIIQ